MQKYINIAFIVALAAFWFYIVRLQTFNELQSVQMEINNQQARIQSLSSNVQTIADFLNQQLELSARQGTQHQASPPTSASVDN